LRDPYAIYAECILRLPVLPPLRPTADALLRGEVSHRVFETFLKRGVDPSDPAAPAAFLATAREVIDTTCPWPLARRLWLARLARIADRFIADERARQAVATPAFLETAGRAEVAQTGFTLTAQADRIDIGPDGRAFIYDYKTGRPPSRRQQMHLDKQLLLEAAMLAQGGFAGPGPREVAGAAYIGVGLSPEVVPAPLDEVTPAAVWADLGRLVALWQRQERGYTARRAVARADAAGPYDHLARHGEWDMTAAPEPEDLA
jgi:RecB family exonuclease